MTNKEINHLQISVWLLPEKDMAGSLSADMKKLAAQFDAPEFSPHITLYSVRIPANNLSEVENFLRRIGKNLHPFSLDVLGSGQTETLFKSLYLQLSSSEELDRVFQKIKTGLGKYGDYILEPHLSLLYKEGIEEEEKNKALNMITIPSKVTINRLALKVSGPQDDFGKDIYRWKFEVIN